MWKGTNIIIATIFIVYVFNCFKCVQMWHNNKVFIIQTTFFIPPPKKKYSGILFFLLKHFFLVLWLSTYVLVRVRALGIKCNYTNLIMPNIFPL